MFLRAQDDWSDVFDFLLLPILDQQYLVRMVRVKKVVYVGSLRRYIRGRAFRDLLWCSCCVHGHSINQ